MSDKEELFCLYYAVGRDETEAAGLSGYRQPSKAGKRLIRKEEIRRRILELDSRLEIRKADVLSGYRRLAFGSSADAISILFDDELTKEKLQSMELFNIASVKRAKGGAVEVRFFDRQKALDRLSEFAEGKADGAENELFRAISDSAALLFEK